MSRAQCRVLMSVPCGEFRKPRGCAGHPDGGDGREKERERRAITNPRGALISSTYHVPPRHDIGFPCDSDSRRENKRRVDGSKRHDYRICPQYNKREIDLEQRGGGYSSHQIIYDGLTRPRIAASHETAAVTTMTESYGCRLRAVVYNGRAYRAVNVENSLAESPRGQRGDRLNRRRDRRKRKKEGDDEHVPRLRQRLRSRRAKTCARPCGVRVRERASSPARCLSSTTPRRDRKEGINGTHRRLSDTSRSVLSQLSLDAAGFGVSSDARGLLSDR